MTFIANSSPWYFSVPKEDQQTTVNEDDDSRTTSTNGVLIPLISFRALLLVEDILVGIRYDGPDARWLTHFRSSPLTAADKVREALRLPHEMNIHLRNGMEDTWHFRNEESSNDSLCFAFAETFVFVDSEDRKWNGQRNILRFFDVITRIRDIIFLSSMTLPDFPIYHQISSYVPHHPKHLQTFTAECELPSPPCETLNSARGLLLCDTGLTLSLCEVILNFSEHTLQFHEFFLFSVPPTTSLLLSVPDANLLKQTVQHFTRTSLDNFGLPQLSDLLEALNVSEHSRPINTETPQIDQSSITPHIHHPSAREFPTNSSQPFAQTLREILVAYDLSNRPLLIFDANRYKTGQDSLHPSFALFDTAGFSLYTALDHFYRFEYGYPLEVSPLFVIFIPSFSYFVKATLDHVPPSKTTHKHRISDVNSKLLIGGGEEIISVIQGKVQKQFFPDKYIQGAALATCSYFYIRQSPNIHLPPRPISADANYTVLPLINLDDGTQICIKKYDTKVFLSSARNQPLLLNLDKGTFVNVPQGDDFSSNPMSVHTVSPFLSMQMGEGHRIEQSLMVGGGIGKAGSINVLTSAHSLVPMQRGQWFDKLPTIFSTKLFAGMSLYSILLISEHCKGNTEYEKKQMNEEQALRLAMLNESFTKAMSIAETSDEILKKTFTPDHLITHNVFPMSSPSCSRPPLRYPEYKSTELALRPKDPSVINGASVGVDSFHRTLTLAGAQGALVQVTSCEIRIVPTVRYEGQIVMVGKEKNRATLSITAEPIFPNVAEGLCWRPPAMHTIDQVDYFLDHIDCSVCPCHLRAKKKRKEARGRKDNPQQRAEDDEKDIEPCRGWMGSIRFVELELASVTDNLIAASCGSTVFVHLWVPSKPSLRGVNVTDAKGKPNYIISKPQLQHISTLTFPSRVTALSTTTICGRPFLLVGCADEPSVRLFRADDYVTAMNSKRVIEQYWDESRFDSLNDPTIQYLSRPSPAAEFQRLSRHWFGKDGPKEGCVGKERQKLREYLFVEVGPKSGLFLRNIHTSNCVMTELFRMDLEFNPVSILMTTFDRRLKGKAFDKLVVTEKDRQSAAKGLERLKQPFLSNSTSSSTPTSETQKQEEGKKQEEEPEVVTDDSSSDFEPSPNIPWPAPVSLSLVPTNSAAGSHPSRIHTQTDGVAILVGCYHGGFSSTLLPLSDILDFPPHPSKTGTTSDSSQTGQTGSVQHTGQPGGTRKGEKLKSPNETNSDGQRSIFSPIPEIRTCYIGRSRVMIVDNSTVVYLLNEKTYMLSWHDTLGEFQWVAVQSQGPLHALVPVTVAEDDDEMAKSKSDELLAESGGKRKSTEPPKSPNSSHFDEKSVSSSPELFFRDPDTPFGHSLLNKPPSMADPLTTSIPAPKALNPGDNFTLAWISHVDRVFPDHVTAAYNLLLPRVHFGDVWQSGQKQMLEEFRREEMKMFQRYCEQNVADEKKFSYTGPPMLLSSGRYVDVRVINGLSPLPLSSATYRALFPTAHLIVSATKEVQNVYRARKAYFVSRRASTLSPTSVKSVLGEKDETEDENKSVEGIGKDEEQSSEAQVSQVDDADSISSMLKDLPFESLRVTDLPLPTAPLELGEWKEEEGATLSLQPQREDGRPFTSDEEEDVDWTVRVREGECGDEGGRMWEDEEIPEPPETTHEEISPKEV
ncbi:hypothetical protein BLNAU_16576 [Blattamonas nauphoetae]|uniref:Uncharacterized protein n=1 Tax=Blattamonas nauphoetae TaxID=2049346 RepID=A0ABQ9XCX8_9EUKA|nr:hypothetical protein BLNAU_16576 [Blattamonas nauphoetae]